MKFKRRNRNRSGTAATECAICLPVLLTLTLATLEFTAAIFLKETLTIAAYEGARVAVQRKATNAQAEATIEEMLTARGVTGGTHEVSPNDVTTTKALDVITVTVTAPLEGNSFFIGKFMGTNISATVKMRREFDE